MNDMNEEITLDDELDAMRSQLEGLTASVYALAFALKRTGSIDERVLEEKVHSLITHTSATKPVPEQFERPLKHLLWALSDQSPDAELRIFGDLRANRAPTPPAE